jgi:hypothetical protein
VLKGGAAAAAAVMLPAGVARAQIADIPRNRTVVLIGINSRDGRWVDYELWNPYAIGSNHQNGPNLIYEPLAYYGASMSTRRWMRRRSPIRTRWC